MADEVKVEEVKTEEVVADAPVAEEKKEVSGKFADLIKQIEGLTALELSELVKALEDRFGVSAAAPVAAAGAPAAAGAAAADEEKANYNVVLTNGGSNKIGAIKAVREILPELGLVEAKELVENAPKTLKESVPTEEAKVMKEKLEAAGAVAELQ
jgi:large subunit ribosomal protein L7/L12